MRNNVPSKTIITFAPFKLDVSKSVLNFVFFLEPLVPRFLPKMIAPPPVVPREYVLKRVTDKYASAPEHSNMWTPRVTQTTLGLFAHPLFPLKREKPGEFHVAPVNDRVLDVWTTQNRAWWVEKPGTNAKLMDDMIRKFSVVVEKEIDPRYKHRRMTSDYTPPDDKVPQSNQTQ